MTVLGIIRIGGIEMKFSERTKTPKIVFLLLFLLLISSALSFNLIFFGCTILAIIPFMFRYKKAPLFAFGVFTPLIISELIIIMPFYNGYSRFRIISSTQPELLLFFTGATIIEIILCLTLLYAIKKNFIFSFIKQKKQRTR